MSLARIEYNCVVLNETDKAWLVEIDGEEIWLPKSQCECHGDSITVPRWLAREKGLE